MERGKKVISDFLSAHTRHVPLCQYYKDTCPLCNLVVREQTDIYPTLLEDVFRPYVYRFCQRWVEDLNPEILTAQLAFSALSRWVQPKYRDIPDLTEDELVLHPFVKQKIGGK
jgi:hypothetical protein